MNCTICKNGETHQGTATVTLERNESVIVFKDVPADVCNNCGEYYLSEETSKKLYSQASSAVESGAVFEVCRLKVA